MGEHGFHFQGWNPPGFLAWRGTKTELESTGNRQFGLAMFSTNFWGTEGIRKLTKSYLFIDAKQAKLDKNSP